jgi:TnpA family transposase
VPRLRDLKDWSLYTFADADPLLRQHIGGRIDERAIREAWDEMLRIALSVENREVAPSVVLKKLAAMPKTNLLARALREIGRIERTLFMIEWYSSPALCARCRAGLNKCESGHKLTRAVFFHERGEIRDAAFEGARRFGPRPSIWWSAPSSCGTPSTCRGWSISSGPEATTCPMRSSVISRRRSGSTST